MQSILVERRVLEGLKHEAQAQARNVNEIANETFENYLKEKRRGKLLDEVQAYIKLHPRLRKKYLSEWVAIHEHKLVDHDANRVALRQRVRAKYGRTAVLIRHVEKQADYVVE